MFLRCPARRAALSIAVGALACGVSACRSARPQQPASGQPAIGVAYAGPATMNVRQDLAARSASVIEVKHGDRLEILEERRRLARVRTGDGVEGWVDSSLLLTAAEMDQLKRLAEHAKDLPSQGAAKVFDQLNVHTQPDRFSPSFAQIPEGGALEVLGHQLTPRGTTRPKTALVTKAVAAAKAPKKEARKGSAPALPLPRLAAALPNDWEKLSHPRAADLPGYAAPQPPTPLPADNWNLIRTKDGQAGWVLARMLYMLIPDEVAQYAEGKRIVAYLAIGDVQDGAQVRHNWLWATAASGTMSNEFDSLRVFVWSRTRHRYETAFVERNLTGYYPLQLADIPGDSQKGFSALTQEKDGLIYKRTYAFSGYHVRLISKTPASRLNLVPTGEPALLSDADAPNAQGTGWWRKWRVWFSAH